jgi:hypothetical protein
MMGRRPGVNKVKSRAGRGWLMVACASIAIALLSIYGLTHYWNLLGKRGLNADAAGIAGWTSSMEAVGLLSSLVGFAAGWTMSVVGGLMFRRQTRPEPGLGVGGTVVHSPSDPCRSGGRGRG